MCFFGIHPKTCYMQLICQGIGPSTFCPSVFFAASFWDLFFSADDICNTSFHLLSHPRPVVQGEIDPHAHLPRAWTSTFWGPHQSKVDSLWGTGGSIFAAFCEKIGISPSHTPGTVRMGTSVSKSLGTIFKVTVKWKPPKQIGGGAHPVWTHTEREPRIQVEPPTLSEAGCPTPFSGE